MKKALWWIFVFLAIAVSFNPVIYFIRDRNFGIVGSKSNEVLNSIFWNTGFYIHIIFGGLALLIGWMQFYSNLRSKNLKLHRQIGKIYVVSVLLSSTAGFYIAIFAQGGLIASLGFMCLAIIWFYTTFTAYTSIRNKKVEQHQKMMIYSYAACFAAVTLRLWIPLLTAASVGYITAYRISAWLSWVPNIIVANQIIKRALHDKKQLPLFS